MGTSEVPEDKLLHAASVMAEYLDNNEDGVVDDPPVIEAMQENNALLVMFPTFDDSEDLFESGEDLEPIFENYWI